MSGVAVAYKGIGISASEFQEVKKCITRECLSCMDYVIYQNSPTELLQIKTCPVDK